MQTHSLSDFKTEAKRFALGLTPQALGATTIALSGDVGAGKTTFVQAAAAALGVEEPVRSPTFIIMQIFEVSAGAFKRLIHIDAYRLKSAGELEVLGWAELAADPHNLIFIEWPEMVEAAVPEWAQKVTLVGEGDARTIQYDPEL